jgi:hypothetical protein
MPYRVSRNQENHFEGQRLCLENQDTARPRSTFVEVLLVKTFQCTLAWFGLSPRGEVTYGGTGGFVLRRSGGRASFRTGCRLGDGGRSRQGHQQSGGRHRKSQPHPDRCGQFRACKEVELRPRRVIVSPAVSWHRRVPNNCAVMRCPRWSVPQSRQKGSETSGRSVPPW